MDDMNGINRLARVLQGRIREVSSQPSVIDMATVQADGSLYIEAYELTIPEEEHAKLMTGEEKSKYKAGDRVVIAYADDNIVVLGRLV